MKIFLMILMSLTMVGCGNFAATATSESIKNECLMNGLGEGTCTFTNYSRWPQNACFYIRVKAISAGNGYSKNSSTYCSGPIGYKETKEISFNVLEVREKCNAVYPDTRNWGDICNFQIHFK